jgi:protein-tyrosine-phosphatase
MDCHNLSDMRRRYPAAMHKTYLLGSLDSEASPDIDIPDPYDGPYETTERVCRRIAAAIDGLITQATGSAGESRPAVRLRA